MPLTDFPSAPGKSRAVLAKELVPLKAASISVAPVTGCFLPHCPLPVLLTSPSPTHLRHDLLQSQINYHLCPGEGSRPCLGPSEHRSSWPLPQQPSRWQVVLDSPPCPHHQPPSQGGLSVLTLCVYSSKGFYGELLDPERKGEGMETRRCLNTHYM